MASPPLLPLSTALFIYNPAALSSSLVCGEAKLCLHQVGVTFNVATAGGVLQQASYQLRCSSGECRGTWVLKPDLSGQNQWSHFPSHLQLGNQHFTSRILTVVNHQAS